MARVSEAFPSKYLRAEELNGRQLTLIMERVEFEEIGQAKDRRPVLYFRKATKGLVLNKTNSNTIADIYGDEMDDWGGNPITLVEAMVDYQGKSVPAIRARRPPRPAGNARPTASQQAADHPRPLEDDRVPETAGAGYHTGADLDDSIPF